MRAGLHMRRWFGVVLAVVTIAPCAMLAATGSAKAASPQYADGAMPAVGVITGHGGPVRALTALDSLGAIVTGGFDSAIIVWNLKSGSARSVLRFHDSTVNAVVALKGGCFASAGEDARIAIWCPGSNEPQKVLTGHTAPISALAVSPDGQTLASASWDHSVRLWALDGDKGSRVVEGHKGPVNGIAFLRDGSAIASAGYDGQIRVTSLTDGVAAVFIATEAPVNCIAILPDGNIAAAGADGRLRFYTPSLMLTDDVEIGTGPLTTIAVSPDGAVMATAGMRTPVTLLSGVTRRITHEILGPGLPVWSVGFSRDGGELITGGADRAVRRWDAQTGKPAGDDLAAAVEDVTANDTHPGAGVFRACKACHSLAPGDSIRAGPTLHGIMGRRVASAPGYVYSEALKRLDIIWSPETVARLFEVGPNAYLPGTKMPEQTISNPEDRKALVEWLLEKARP